MCEFCLNGWRTVEQAEKVLSLTVIEMGDGLHDVRQLSVFFGQLRYLALAAIAGIDVVCVFQGQLVRVCSFIL